MGHTLTLTRIVPQHLETPVTWFKYGAFCGQFLYARSGECQAAHDPGQDYLTVRQNGESLAFALCDGVSQSFFGELAARLLGDALLEWLWCELPKVAHLDQAGVALADFLVRLAERGTRLVMNYPLPVGLPAFLVDVLEEKRLHGSESTFACGRIDLAGERTFVAWMGDSRLRLWNESGELTAPFRDAFVTARRWSTRRGPVGGVPALVHPESPLTRVVCYTDGLSVLDSLPGVPSGPELQRLSDLAGEQPDNDDRTLLDIQWGPARQGPPGTAPRRIRVLPGWGATLVTWRPMAGVTGYELELSHGDEVRTFLTGRPPFELPSTGMLRVRAWNGKMPGPWSAPALLPNPK